MIPYALGPFTEPKLGLVPFSTQKTLCYLFTNMALLEVRSSLIPVSLRRDISLDLHNPELPLS